MTAAYPAADPQELATRLGITPSAETLARLGETLAVAAALVTPHTDPDRVAVQPGTYLEAVYQLAVKVWDTATKGAVDLNAVGDFVFPAPAATAGLVRAVWAFIQPLNPTGGLTV
jgi:hypothetical protein